MQNIERLSKKSKNEDFSKQVEEKRPDYAEASQNMIGTCMMETEVMHRSHTGAAMREWDYVSGSKKDIRWAALQFPGKPDVGPHAWERYNDAFHVGDQLPLLVWRPVEVES